MGMDIDNWIIKEQDKNIQVLELEIEILKMTKETTTIPIIVI